VARQLRTIFLLECSGNRTADDLALSPFFPSLVTNNRFERDSINDIPSIAMSPSPWQPTPAVFRDNVFVNCGYAMSGGYAADAQLNFWGHPSGPYHEFDNPQGLGDTITGPVQFIPWLTDTLMSVQGERVELPSAIGLSAYPNPFNPGTRLSFLLNRAQTVKMIVFDVTGRVVQTLTDAHYAAGTHELKFDGASLASGLYFARLETLHNTITAKLILLK